MTPRGVLVRLRGSPHTRKAGDPLPGAVWHDEITGMIAVRFAYDPILVERIKTTIPKYSRQWDKDRKLWLVDPPYEATARRMLGIPTNDSSDAPRDLTDALTAMFKALPEHIHEGTFKALMRVWHPDIGGDTRATQSLNAWRDRRAS